MSGKSKTISHKITELDEIIAWFDSEEFSIEQAVGKYKQAAALAEEIKTELNEFKNEINVLKQRFDKEA